MIGYKTQILPRNPVLEEYAKLAPTYDTRWSFYITMTARETMARLTLQPGDQVLDVGCGTGMLLYDLSHSYPQIQLFGIDPAPEMLAVARRRLSPDIPLLEGWAEQLPFRDNRFDTVISCNVFHYIRQPQLALREIKRVLRPGGRFTVTDWCDDYLVCRIFDLYLRLFNRAHFRTYSKRECIRQLKEAGFTEVSFERYKINWSWGLMTVGGAKPAAEETTTYTSVSTNPARTKRVFGNDSGGRRRKELLIVHQFDRNGGKVS